ncbi:hypothetical protein GN956_G24539 [Arapaima gigas]
MWKDVRRSLILRVGQGGVQRRGGPRCERRMRGDKDSASRHSGTCRSCTSLARSRTRLRFAASGRRNPDKRPVFAGRGEDRQREEASRHREPSPG